MFTQIHMMHKIIMMQMILLRTGPKNLVMEIMMTAMMMHMITGKTQWTRGMAGLECGARCLPEKREEMDK